MPSTQRDKMRELMKVALGEAEADLAIVGGDIANVYTGEVLKDYSVLVKGEKIAYVGGEADKSIGSSTRVIDAAGRTLIPGLIDGHTHIDVDYSLSELIRYAMKGGTTTIITELSTIAFPLGYPGIVEFLRAARNQPIKISVTIPPMVTISPTIREHAITVDQLHKLLKRKEVLGLGESYWAPVIGGDQRLLDMINETLKAGKRVEGHSSGARDRKLQAYASTGVSSCHEPITAEEILERLRLGLFVLIREGDVRRELETVAAIKDEKINFTNLAMSTDGIGPRELTTNGYVERLVQKAIDLGFDPILAIQMATINVARHFGMDGSIGGIAPGKDADIVVIPDLQTIRAEYVISRGKVIARDGKLLVEPRKHNYSRAVRNSIRLPGDFGADDFIIRAESKRSHLKIRVIDQITNLVTREAIIEMPIKNGQIKADTSRDIIKVAAIDRTYSPGRTFTGLLRGIGLRRGAIATSSTWDSGAIIVVGASEADMARAVNRLREMKGGIAVCADGKITAEIAMPVGGMVSTEPMEAISDKFHAIQKAAAELGCTTPGIRLTLSTLTTSAIAHLRICEHGLFSLRHNRFVDLIAEQ